MAKKVQQNQSTNLNLGDRFFFVLPPPPTFTPSPFPIPFPATCFRIDFPALFIQHALNSDINLTLIDQFEQQQKNNRF